MLRQAAFSLPLLFVFLAATQAQTAPQAAPPPSQSAAPITTLRSTAKLVVVDVVVTDKQHRPIHGLKRSDFTLLDNKVPQNISSFEEHSGLTAAERAKIEAFPKLPAGIFTNYTPAPPNSALNVVLLDTLNTPLTNQMYVRQQLLKFVKDAKPGANVAIFGLTTRLILLQSFTSDPEALRRAIDSRKSLRSSALLDANATAGTTADSLADQMADTSMSVTDPELAANLATFDAIQQSFQTSLRARYTLDGFNALARYLAGIPGRKNLIWFSGSFPLDILPDGDMAPGGDPFAGMMDAEEEYRETTNLLASAQVAVYPIDARGLFTNPAFSASNSGANFARNPRALTQANQRFFQQTAAEHSTMQRMAEDTGGEAFLNTNGLSEAVAKAIDFGSNYYTLAYSPANDKWKGQYRCIRVQLAEKGYQLAFRHGYYADDPDAPPKKHAEAPATAAPKPSSLQKAMTRGAPGATQIVFKLQVLPASNATESAVAPENKANPDPKIARGPFRRYTVNYAADPTMIKFQTTPDGFYQAVIDFVVFVYDADGDLVNAVSKTGATHLTEAEYRRLMHGGLPYQQEISVPVKGQYFLRIAVHDLATDAIGSVEIPVSAVKNLPPVASSAPAPSQNPQKPAAASPTP